MGRNPHRKERLCLTHTEGSAARLDGKPESDNPYDLFTQESDYLAWNDGWDGLDEGEDE